MTLGRSRVGLILGLSNLPLHIGAFHQLGSNFIVMNKRLLGEVVKTGNKRLTNAYIFHILLHEYLHSLGYVNEQETQILTHIITEKAFGPDHTATRIARYGIGQLFHSIGVDGSEEHGMGGIEIVEDIDRDNLNYFG
jgi:hypothetical protein